ncbi:MAG: hypothetical protein A3D67_02520 [Candidatus Lloydbacteria bacterium RIFCSPHIGHO2_02_FULL_51_22]|uniref:DUF5667 domain-containing protein n=2 Tax=Candidatus Lloydiibacteriota TaxID=1817910 RepID=A0A1G2DEP8_9BACT|nr:MAG: hypothetical protein A3D67_02520 [Candidatus Lloydbacteria bacterium RIFCSPHIGHO2_02_FULL_51_22]OGZ15908.1 MAG: hypothetical protein A3G11_02325 [Candidatus Lloydbacteria bacterium RIFCSPLOWO2_12_FULL_51_9]
MFRIFLSVLACGLLALSITACVGTSNEPVPLDYDALMAREQYEGYRTLAGAKQARLKQIQAEQAARNAEFERIFRRVQAEVALEKAQREATIRAKAERDQRVFWRILSASQQGTFFTAQSEVATAGTEIEVRSVRR